MHIIFSEMCTYIRPFIWIGTVRIEQLNWTIIDIKTAVHSIYEVRNRVKIRYMTKIDKLHDWYILNNCNIFYVAFVIFRIHCTWIFVKLVFQNFNYIRIKISNIVINKQMIQARLALIIIIISLKLIKYCTSSNVSILIFFYFFEYFLMMLYRLEFLYSL